MPISWSGFEQLVAMPGTHRELCKCYLPLLSKVIPELWKRNTKKIILISKLNANTSTWKEIEGHKLLDN